MNILNNVNRIPGGVMLVPMFITAVINTLAPGVLRIGGPFTGAFTSAGTMTAIGMMLFTAGSQMKYSQISAAVTRGGVLMAVRLVIGFATSWLALSFFGMDGFLGISALSLVICMSSCNPGVYMGLMQSYGDNIDKSAVGILNIIAVPATPLLILGLTSGSGFDYAAALSTLLPFILGMFLGNLDSKIQGMFSPAMPIILAFLGASFGSTINLRIFAQVGVGDIVLAMIVIFISVPVMFLADRLILKRPGYASIAISCVGGTSISAPPIIAAALPQFQPYVEKSIAQMALIVLICVVMIPYITKMAITRFGSGVPAVKEAAAVPVQS